MGLESTTYIDGLVATNPVGATDPKGQGDDHIRLIKAALKATFPNLTGAVTKTQAQLNDPNIPAGSRTVWQQTAAPTGWTKDTTHNNKAFRLVNGTVGIGGSVAFTTAFASQAVTGSNAASALSVAMMPPHTHTQQGTFNTGTVSADHSHGVNGVTGNENQAHNHAVWAAYRPAGPLSHDSGDEGDYGVGIGPSASSGTEQQAHNHNVNIQSGGISANHFHAVTLFAETAASGSGATHNHTFTGTAINLAVQYVDFIIASKD